MKIALPAIAVALPSAGARGAYTAAHAAQVEAFARIMADVRTAAERCPDLSVDWSAVNAEKERLQIADVDYFAFRKKAHDLADDLEKRLVDEGSTATWCSRVFDQYGPHGPERANLLHR